MSIYFVSPNIKILNVNQSQILLSAWKNGGNWSKTQNSNDFTREHTAIVENLE